MLEKNYQCLIVFFGVFFFFCFIYGIVSQNNRPNQEFPVWYHLPICHNVNYDQCLPPATGSVSGSLTRTTTSKGCCSTYTPVTTQLASTTRSKGTFYPASHLQSRWFGTSEYKSGAPSFFDYTGTRTTADQPYRSITGQCAAPDANPNTGMPFKYTVPKILMEKGFGYMPKIMRTDGLAIESLIIKVTGGKETKTYDLSPVPGKTTTNLPFSCGTSATSADVATNPAKTVNVQSPMRRALENKEMAENNQVAENNVQEEPTPRRRALLKGGSSYSSRSSSSSSRYGTSGSSRRRTSSSRRRTGYYDSNSAYSSSESPYRSRHSTTVVYMNSRTRTRTNYGYEEKQHVAAASTGVVVEVDYPTNARMNTPSNYANNTSTNKNSNPNLATNRGFTERFLLQDRSPYVGSNPSGQSVASKRLSSFYTDYNYNVATRIDKPTAKFASATRNGNVAVPQTIYKDLTGTQMGEDNDRSQLLINDGTVDWTFEISFKGSYNPKKSIENQIKRDSTFPSIYVTFVTPDDNSNYGTGVFLIIFSVFGFLCCCFTVNSYDHDDLGDDDMCIPCCCFSGRGSSSRSNYNRRGNKQPTVVVGGMSGFNSYSAPKAASNDGVTMVNDTQFDYAVSNARSSTRGLGRSVHTKKNDDYRTIPTGRFYTAVVIPSNDVGSLNGQQDQYIQYIDVHSNDINNLNGLSNYQALEALICTDNNLSNISFSGASNNLKVLDVGSNNITKLFPNKQQGQYNSGHNTNYPNLNLFVCPNNEVENINGLAASCPRLQVIDMRNNDLHNVFSELAHLPCLTHVNLSHNSIVVNGNDLMDFATTCSPTLQHLNIMENDIPKSKLRQMRDIMSRRGLNVTILADDGADANAPAVVIGTANPMY